MTNVIKVDFNNQTQVFCDYNTQLDNQVVDEIKQLVTTSDLDNCRRAIVHFDGEKNSFNFITKEFEVFYIDDDTKTFIRVATLDDLLNFYLLNKENVAEEIINHSKTA
ncbi:hypothetical protein N9Y74_01410 [Alphaproteobacteria bacterium]|nr:hypothetical protein [Alphaproteobacteria bacterium]